MNVLQRRKVLWVSTVALDAIRAEQKMRGWTDARMAEALGIKRPHWVAARQGKRNLPFIAVCRAHQLGVDVRALLWREPD